MLGLGLGLSGARRAAWWPQGADFAADFVNDRYMRAGSEVTAAAAISFSRASKKWAIDRTGSWREFAVNALARTDLGASIEPAAANMVPNPRLDGAVVGIHGAGGSLPTGWYHNGPLTTEIIAITTLAGLPALRIKVHGVAAGSFYELSTMPLSSPMAPSTAYAASMFVVLHGGAAPQLELRQATSSDGFLNVTLLTPPVTTTVTRPAISLLSQPTTARGRLRLSYSLTIGQSYSHEFTVAYPQCETGSVVSSPVVGARTADILTLALPAGLHNVRLERGNGSAETLEAFAQGDQIPTSMVGSTITRLVAYP